MRKTWIGTYLYEIGFMLSMFCLSQGHSTDIAIITGTGSTVVSCDAPLSPLAYSLSIGNNSASSINIPNVSGELGPLAIDGNTGKIIFANIFGDNDMPQVYTGSVVSSAVNSIGFPPGTPEGGLYVVAFDSKGTSILGGEFYNDENTIAAYKLFPGSNHVIPISFSEVVNGRIIDIGIFSNNTAILVGQNYSNSSPLIALIPDGETEASLISLPDSTITGGFYCVAVSPDGSTAIMAGYDSLNNQTLIYKFNLESKIASAISIPDPTNAGYINDLAFTSDGSAILGGNANYYPLMYRISPNSDSASIIANASNDPGNINGVATGSDGTAILVGNINNFPLIYKIPAGASQATSIPVSTKGYLSDVAIGSNNIAVIVGTSEEISGIIYTMPTTGTEVSSIVYSSPLSEVAFFEVAIYSSDGLYDIRRIAPYYYNQINETRNLLQQAGL